MSIRHLGVQRMLWYPRSPRRPGVRAAATTAGPHAVRWTTTG
ncbi:hypothetical protein [Nocardia carnea]|nr:hypothetical protein [Nocardia carnea]